MEILMRISFANLELPATGVLVVFATATGKKTKLSETAAKLDAEAGGAVSRAIKASRFKGHKEQTLTLFALDSCKLERVVLVGLGKAQDIDDLRMQAIGGEVYASLSNAPSTNAKIAVDEIEGCEMTGAEMAADAAYGAVLRSYRFDKYRTKLEADKKPVLKSMCFLSNRVAVARTAYAVHAKVAEGVFMTRDLVSEPPNVLFPASLAARARELSKLGVKVEVLGAVQMKKLGMGALLGVAQGSVKEAHMVVMRWNGAPRPRKGKKLEAPIAFVGKGVTFDSGGISIKPSAGMEDMKWDMGGSGVVIGLMRALAGRKAKCDVVGVVGLVENMPGGNAQRPGDIVTSMSGQTIEVLNTDAEGRLVLADALHYTIDRFKPRFVVNLATLTGAIIIALGNEHAGLFSNNDQLSERLLKAGEDVDEKVWRFPLHDTYDKMIESGVADMQNIGSRGAGSITAAQFLKRFVGKTPWSHLDIAGVTWSVKDKPTVPKGGTAFGVRLLNRLVANHYEGK